MSKVFEWLRHNTPLATGLIVSILIAGFAYGCQSTGPSIVNPGTKVNASELKIEVDQITAEYAIKIQQAELSLQDIVKQDAIKQKLFEFGAIVVETGTFNPIGLIGLLGWVLGTTSYINGRGKDKIIARDVTLLGKSA